jgi:hypothetical protein
VALRPLRAAALRDRGEEVVLGKSDAAHFDADRPHRFEAMDGRDAEAIVVACAVPYLLLRSYL